MTRAGSKSQPSSGTRPVARRASSKQDRAAAGKTTGARRWRKATSSDHIPGFSIEHLDRHVDPAQDFYEFATGRWRKTHPIPADKSRWGGFSELMERNYRLLHELLEGAAARARDTDSPVEQKVGDLFASGLDQARRDRIGFRPILGELSSIERMRTPRDLIPLLGRFHRRGVQGVFASRVYPDRKRSSIYALYLMQGGLSLPDREYYLSSDFKQVREKYELHLGRMFKLAGAATAEAERQAATVLDLETSLARPSRARADLRDPIQNYHPYSIEDLHRTYGHLQWPRYLAALQIPPLDGVIVGQPEFFDALDHLVPERDLSDWKTYLRWHYLHQSAPYLHRAAEEEDFRFFHRVLLDQKEPEPDWRRSATTVDRFLGEALGELYVRRYFPPKVKARMEELVRDLQTVFRDRLQRLPWMTPTTRTQALAKFERFTTKIGHPEKFRDYSSVRISRTDYFGNVGRAARFESQRRLRRAGEPVDRTEWQMTPPTVNAYYDPSFNEIVFPAGILQPPFFDFRMDDAVNLGGIGAVIGHEITHGYDDQGRKFDATGNLRDWWTPRDTEEFQSRAERVVHQYGAYEPLPGVHVNGALTTGENIADFGGVSIAFEALERRLADGRTADRKIDGFTPRQRFFLSYAQIWRENVREPDLRWRLTADPHSPGRFRAIGPLSNFLPFWEAFQVPEGSPMRVAELARVSIW